MSEISNKAIMIAVSLLVTIAITSSIIAVMGYFREIYAEVDKTDISIRKGFTEYDMYDNTVMTGLQFENTFNKYKENPTVVIYLRGNIVNSMEYKTADRFLNENLYINNVSFGMDKQFFYATKFNVSCTRPEEIPGDSKVRIYFN